MSQFDFPRVHVRGLISINVGTANNDDYAADTVVPTYKQDEPELAAYDKLPFRLADTDLVQPIDFGKGDDEFLQWASGPVEVYNNGDTSKPPIKVIPAEWNYYGSMSIDMEFDYTGKDGNSGTSFVKVATVQTDPDRFIDDVITLPTDQQPLVKRFLGATLSFKKRSRIRHSTAMMIDCSQEGSSQSSQVIADNLMLENNGEILLSRILDINGNYTGGGHPSKGSTWWLNFQRNVNFGGPGGAAGVFQHVMLFEDGVEYTALKNLFEEFKPPGETRVASGVIFRYAIFRVQGQYRNDLAKLTELYKSGGTNPGVGEVVGTLAPWYDDDTTETVTLGRALTPMFRLDAMFGPNPEKLPGSFPKPPGGVGNFPVCRLAPMTVKVQAELGCLSIDAASAFPENYQKSPADYDAYHDDADPVTTWNPKYNLEALSLNLNVPGRVAPVRLATLGFDKSTAPNADGFYGTEAYNNHGGMLDVRLTFEGYTTEDLACGTLSIESEKYGRMLEENDLMITSNTPTLYTEQVPGATAEIFNFNGNQQPCMLNIFYKGRPISGQEYDQLVKDGKGLVVKEFRLNPLELQEFYNDPLSIQKVENLQYRLSTAVDVATTKICAVTQNGVPPIKGGDLQLQSQIDTLIHPLIYVRILPNEDFSQYYEEPDAAEPIGNDSLTFGVIYEKVFRNYYLLYPVMNQMVPMNDPQQWEGTDIARRLMNRIDPKIWFDYEYMPRTRDLSHTRRELLQAWVRKIFKNAEAGQPTTRAASSAAVAADKQAEQPAELQEAPQADRRASEAKQRRAFFRMPR